MVRRIHIRTIPVFFALPDEIRLFFSRIWRMTVGLHSDDRRFYRRLQWLAEDSYAATALIPAYKYINAKFAEPRRLNFASKLYRR